MPAWRARFVPDPDLGLVRRLWADLEPRAERSIFQSWAWLGPWLATVRGRAEIGLLHVERDGAPVCLGLLGSAVRRRRRIFVARQILVSEAGSDALDNLTVEHNGFLIERGAEEEALPRAFRALRDAPAAWDELIVSGIGERSAPTYDRAAQTAGLGVVERASVPYY